MSPLKPAKAPPNRINYAALDPYERKEKTTYAHRGLIDGPYTICFRA